MALREIGEKGNTYEVTELSYRADFDRVWLRMTARQRAEIEREIGRRLDRLIASPDANWGSITNTSIEGGKPNPTTGVRGEWAGSPFRAIYEASNRNEELAAKIFGTAWKMVIIQRPELWIGIRSDPTFPQRGITLQGKTYFLGTSGK
jgi:hypothetical protein